MEYYHSVTVGPTTIISNDYDIMAPVAAIFTQEQAHRKVFAFRAGNVAIRVKGGGRRMSAWRKTVADPPSILLSGHATHTWQPRCCVDFLCRVCCSVLV